MTHPTMHGTPPAEVPLSEQLVRQLLQAQHPDLATLRLQAVDAGWDNALFRLGDALAVRMPRRAAAASLILNEQAWLPRIAAQLRLPAPVPVRVGMPASGYPWHWSVVAWLLGEAADQHPPAASEAAVLGRFLRELHQPAPADAPANPFRGVPLRERAASAGERIQRLARQTQLFTPAVAAAWQAGLAASDTTSRTWLHGDLHPRNILVEHGRISGIIDWGDVCAGDPATDLAAAWMLFEHTQQRHECFAAYGSIDQATLLRTRGWAILFGVMLLDSGIVDNPRNAQIGAATLRRVDHDGVTG